MAYVHVRASGSNTSPYDTWANAATSLVTALAFASAGDVVVAHSAINESVASTTTFTVAAGVQIISTSDTANDIPTIYVAGARFVTTGNSSITINGGAWYGYNIFAGSSSSPTLSFGTVDGTTTYAEDCTFRIASGSSTSTINVGSTTANTTSILRTRNCTFSFSAAGQGFNVRGPWYDIGSNLNSATVTNVLFKTLSVAAYVDLTGSDMSANPNTLFASGSTNYVAYLRSCKLNSSATIPPTFASDAAGQIYVYDCSGSDVHYFLAHYSYRGKTEAVASQYVTTDGATYDGTNRHSLKITGLNCSPGAPYRSPWIDVYTDGGSAVTPYFEVARDGSATPYTDAEVYGEFLAETEGASPIVDLYSDRTALLGTPANQATGVGTGSWTGLSGTAWSGKVDSGAAITPAEIGFVRGRLVIATNDTVYLDPKVRGLGVNNVLERVTPSGFINDTSLSAGGSSVALPPVRVAA